MKITLLVVALSIVFVACAQTQSATLTHHTVPPLEHNTETEAIKTLDDGTLYIIHPDELRSGGPPKDGIPSIDDPIFLSVEEADLWLDEGEQVMIIEHKGEHRAYPLQVMVWHEIVNDVIQDDPIIITYCPLCGSGIAYYRWVNDQPAEFGVSGKLYNSNLVMYDRLTDSYWSQVQGRAIVGPMTGTVLEQLATNIVRWGDYKLAHPDAKVLSKETGHERDYGRDPYGDYYTSNNLYFPVENEDDSIFRKDVVFGINIDGVTKAYRELDLEQHAPFEDEVNGVPLLIERSDIGIVKITNQETGAQVPHERDFWFAWFAFHPDTRVWSN